jgi:hypothetical protein
MTAEDIIVTIIVSGPAALEVDTVPLLQPAEDIIVSGPAAVDTVPLLQPAAGTQRAAKGKLETAARQRNLRAWLEYAGTAVSAMPGTVISPPLRDPGTVRLTQMACLPLCCLPCILWSTFWRVLLCPFNHCESGKCTALSDDCIGTVMNDASYAKVTADLTWAAVEAPEGQRPEIQAVFVALAVKLSGLAEGTTELRECMRWANAQLEALGVEQVASQSSLARAFPA